MHHHVHAPACAAPDIGSLRLMEEAEGTRTRWHEQRGGERRRNSFHPIDQSEHTVLQCCTVLHCHCNRRAPPLLVPSRALCLLHRRLLLPVRGRPVCKLDAMQSHTTQSDWIS